MAKAKILLLGDKAGGDKLLLLRLRRLGYTSVSATTAEAIKMTAEVCPGLVVLDAGKGRQANRVGLASALKARFEIPVLFLGSAAEKKKILRTGQFSSAEFLVKSMGDAELQARLAAALLSIGTKLPALGNKSWCHSVVCSIRDSVIVTENTGIVLFLNPAAEKLTGWTLDSATGQPLSEVLKAVGEENMRPISLSLTKAPRRKSTGIPERLIISVKGGTAKHVESSVAALSGPGGKVIGRVLVFRDVTEHYLIARSALTRQKIEAVGTLAHGIAHDFGNLIEKVDAHALSLADSLIPGTKVHETTMRILDATREARELTSHLSELAQASEPRAKLTTSPVSASQVIADGAKVLEKTFAEKRIAFAWDVPAKVPLLQANATQLLDSLICVFLNSVDAMPDGGTLTVHVSVRNFARPGPRLNPEARTGRYAVVSIADTGLGMTRETVAHIFEPFFTTKQPGLVKGLGLTIVHATILGWGGWITVKSAPRKGTTVHLHIPVADVPASAPAADSEGGVTVLVIDDNNDDLALFRTILEEQGHKVHTATSGADGLSMLHGFSGTIDLVIVDLIMPEIDGGEVLRRLLERDPSARVIVASGFSRDYVRAHIGQGGWGFVQKPVEKDQLLHAVSRALEQPLTAESGNAPEKADGNSKGSGVD